MCDMEGLLWVDKIYDTKQGKYLFKVQQEIWSLVKKI
jgi:hypothetical protein